MSWITFDITFCNNGGCKLADKCFRVAGMKDPDFPAKYFSLAEFEMKDGKCEHFISLKEAYGDNTGSKPTPRKSKQNTKLALDKKKTV
jgi:hypothetical protein